MPARHPGSKRKKPGAEGRADDEAPPRSCKKPRPNIAEPARTSPGPAVQHALLPLYYPRVQTLRAHLLDRLPATSRLRRKRLALVGLTENPRPVELHVRQLLDHALVGSSDKNPNESHPGSRRPLPDDRPQQRNTYMEHKRADESTVTVTGAQGGTVSPQSEIVDFSVWLLFKRAKEQFRQFQRPANAPKWINDLPQNVLCHGFQRGDGPRAMDVSGGPSPYPCGSTIPDLFCIKPPQNAQVLKEAPWPQVLALLGKSGETIMTDLLMDCSVFLPVTAGCKNFVQLTGKPLCNVEPLSESNKQTEPAKEIEKSHADIAFVRSRMFYAKPSITKRGKVHFGLKHIHVLNRLPYRNRPTKKITAQGLAKANDNSTLHVMLYLFPRQFGLHNVFTSAVDRMTTTQKLQDYTLRETEIKVQFGNIKNLTSTIRIPRRLRGQAFGLVEKLRVLHSRCSYFELLQHYCPDTQGESTIGKVPAAATPKPVQDSVSCTVEKILAAPASSTTPPTRESKPLPDKKTPLVDLATPLQCVSAFCQAVFSNVVPNEFWGTGDVQAHNKKTVLKMVDLFLRLRRFETLNLHDFMQGIKIAAIPWLAPPGLHGHLSRTDLDKRRQMFAELLYYLVDSFLIPLVRSNFYVTESSSHRNKLFYFRHDVWRRITEPCIGDLKVRMFEDIKHSDAVATLANRELGYGQIRMLPKQATVRPIMNMRRRATIKGGDRLTASANSILTPVHAMLKLEVQQNPDRMGSGMLSVRAIYDRIKAFKKRMTGDDQTKFFLAKVDVKSAFDTMPQEPVVAMVRQFLSHPAYNMDRHVEITAPELRAGTLAPSRTWKTVGSATADATGFHDVVNRDFAARERNTVFVDTAFRRKWEGEVLANLTESHVLQNLVKIGKKFYRQKNGIPQGSVLSALLCSCFYGQLEAKKLAFLGAYEADSDGDTLLLRLIDDFLLITTDQRKAARFVQVMHRGLPEYGVAVNPDKSLVNFALQTGGKTVARVAADAWFPYCGMVINGASLDLAKDWEAKKQVVFDTLTVEYSRSPGRQFKRKIAGFFKVQSSGFFDTAHNSMRTTIHNLHKAFGDTAVKLWAYARCLPADRRPSTKLVIDTIQQVYELALANLRGKAARLPAFRFSVGNLQLRWLLLHAFFGVLKTKQAAYGGVLAWLRGEMRLLHKHELRLPRTLIDE